MNSANILINIRKIVRSVNLESKRIQKEYGISIPQLLVLQYLNNKKGEVASHGEISKYLNLNHSTVTGIVNRLCKKAYLEKKQDEKDRRIVNVSLTEASHTLLNNTPQLWQDELSAKLSKLPKEKIVQIEDSFRLIIKALGIEELAAYDTISGESDQNLL